MFNSHIRPFVVLLALILIGATTCVALGADASRRGHDLRSVQPRVSTGTADQPFRMAPAMARALPTAASNRAAGLSFDQPLVTTGCTPGLPQTVTLKLANRTGAPGLVRLEYIIDDAQGFISGPESVYLGAWDEAAIDVTVVADPALPPGQTISTSVLALGLGLSAATDIQSLMAVAVWELIATEPDSGRMDNVVAAYNGLAWSITGYGANTNVRVYNPATDAWSTIAGSAPPFGVNYARSGAVYGSKVYMYGDSTTVGFTGLWSYNMATNVWTHETPTGTPPPYAGIWAPAWVADPETGILYMTGGSTVPGTGNLSTVYVYNPATNAWLASLPNFTTVRDFHAAFIFRRPGDNHKLLCVAGGNSGGAGITSTQCYDFNTGTWGAENATVSPLPTDHWGMGYCQLSCNQPQLWMVGGVLDSSITSLSYYYDVNTGTWESGGPFPSPSVYRTSAVALDGTIYKLGGSIASFSYTGTASRIEVCDVYDLIFVDDHGRSKLCINSDTGDYVYHVLTGTGAGEYTGTGVFKAYNYGYYFYNQDGNPWLVYVNHATNINRATGYLKWGAKRINSVLYDRITTDNPDSCD
ncbi:MAG TPA: kelch repeat-containing protein [Acidobacteriota bacterium]|nr:kelch repeat-containing protein [Acidobacteriota bacterium]HQG90693.1 kelch repeat-containing protein [Acidobacteriota bacterium]